MLIAMSAKYFKQLAITFLRDLDFWAINSSCYREESQRPLGLSLITRLSDFLSEKLLILDRALSA